MLDKASSIYNYLYFGYLPQDKLLMPIELQADVFKRQEQYQNKNSMPSYQRLVEEGANALETAFESTLNEVAEYPQNVLYVVPISGGMDSRAILSWLIEHIDRKQIYTVTFGLSGAWDFEIGQLVAKEAGVKNEIIDLSSIEWQTDKLLAFARLCERPLPAFESYLFHQIRVLFGKDFIYWSGFMGEALSGDHLPAKDSLSWNEAKESFVSRERFSNSVPLTPPHFNPNDYFASGPLVEKDILSFNDQLDFGVRQQNYIRPLVQLKGYKYCAPFLHPNWVNFILQVPREYRRKQKIYKDILLKNYPQLFSLPTKTNFGLPLDAPFYRELPQLFNLKAYASVRKFFPRVKLSLSPWTNYIDFESALREREDLKSIVYMNLQDLKNRNIIDWLDLKKIWHNHQQRQGSYADALTLLASLEINLKCLES